MDIRKQQTQKNYNEITQLYTEDFGEIQYFFDEFFDPLVSNLTQNNLKNTVVDLGTGPGNVVDYLLKFDIKNKIIGVEFAQEFCNKLKIKYSDKPQVDIVCDDFVDYVAKQPADSISAYVANYSIIHIPNEEINDLFKNIQKSLQRNGMIAFSLWEGEKKGMRQEPYQIENDQRLRTNSFLESYINDFTKKEIEKILKKVGLKIIKINVFDKKTLVSGYIKPRIFVLAQK